MATPVSPILVNPDPLANFDADKVKAAGYSDEEIGRIQRALASGYSIKDIDAAFANQRATPRTVPQASEANQSLLSRIMEAAKPFIRPVVAGGAAGMAATAALPLTGPAGSALAGTGTYTAVDLALKNAMQGGMRDAQTELMDTGTSAVTNELGGLATRALGRGILAYPTKKRLLERGQQLATQVTGGRPPDEATDPYYLASSLKQDIENVASKYNIGLFSKQGFQKVLQEEGEGSPLVAKVMQINRDPAKIQQFIDAGGLRLPGVGKLMSNNPRADLAGFELTQLTRKGPRAALDALEDVNNKEAYAKLFSQQTRANMEQLFKSAVTRDIIVHPFGEYTKRVVMIGAGLRVGTSLFSGNLSPLGATEAAITGVIIGGKALNKVLTNTPLARALTRIGEGTAAGMSDQAISRMLVGVLQGQAISMVDDQGNEIKGTVERRDDGSSTFVPSDDQQQYQPSAAF